MNFRLNVAILRLSFFALSDIFYLLQYDTTQTYGNDSKHLLTFIGVLHSLLLLLIGGTERELKWCEEAAGGGGVGCSIVIDEP